MNVVSYHLQVWRRAPGEGAAEVSGVWAHRAESGGDKKGAPGGQPGLLPHQRAAPAGAAAGGRPHSAGGHFWQSGLHLAAPEQRACYPTSARLPLAPLLLAGPIQQVRTCDFFGAVSGVTGPSKEGILTGSAEQRHLGGSQ